MELVDYFYVMFNRVVYSFGFEVKLYDFFIEEFSVVRMVFRGNGLKVMFDLLDGLSIIICMGGKGKISVGLIVKEIKEGYVYFVGVIVECVLESEVDGDEDEFVIFKVYCEVEEMRNGV